MALGVCLPEDYRRFLLGPEDAPVRRRFSLGAEERWVSCFYALGVEDPMSDLLARREALQGIVARDLLAIGRDDHGDLVCLGVSGPRMGAVYLVRLRPLGHRQLPSRWLAATFGAFVASAGN